VPMVAGCDVGECPQGFPLDESKLFILKETGELLYASTPQTAVNHRRIVCGHDVANRLQGGHVEGRLTAPEALAHLMEDVTLCNDVNSLVIIRV
jgi:hypothetical protein